MITYEGSLRKRFFISFRGKNVAASVNALEISEFVSVSRSELPYKSLS